VKSFHGCDRDPLKAVEQKELQRVEALVEAGASPTVPEPFQPALQMEADHCKFSEIFFLIFISPLKIVKKYHFRSTSVRWWYLVRCGPWQDGPRIWVDSLQTEVADRQNQCQSRNLVVVGSSATSVEGKWI
jgi:hypothetical protein